MEAHFEDRLRGHLGKLLTNENASIADFQQWFMTAWWEAEDGVSDELYELGSHIEHLLYIWSSGEWSDNTFRSELNHVTHDYFASQPAATVR